MPSKRQKIKKPPRPKFIYSNGNLIGKYRVIKPLFQSQKSELYKVEFDTEFRVLKLYKQYSDEIAEQVSLLLSLNHPRIMLIEEHFQHENNDVLIFEYAPGGDLLDDIQKQPNNRYTELEAQMFFIDLVDGVSYLHSKGIMHRDLKLENILITKTGLKITDFEYATKELTSMAVLGTREYLAPEMITDKDREPYDNKVDCWCLGIILYELLYGSTPFSGIDDAALYFNIQTEPLMFPLFNSDVSEDAKNLVIGLLIKNPADRLTCREILEHPWMNPDWKAS